jgi:uncharacterized membrane protein YecN with MAPEG domain
MPVILAVANEFGYVLLSVALLAFECILIGFFFPGRVRSQVFTEEFMKSKFGRVHTEEVGGEIGKGGYPDMGSGKYSQELTYSDWYRFNNAQRAHYNFVEGISTAITLIVVGGIYYPIVSASFGLAMIIGRIIYSIGYTAKGAPGRLVGVALIDIALVATLVLSIMTCVKMILGHSITQ